MPDQPHSVTTQRYIIQMTLSHIFLFFYLDLRYEIIKSLMNIFRVRKNLRFVTSCSRFVCLGCWGGLFLCLYITGISSIAPHITLPTRFASSRAVNLSHSSLKIKASLISLYFLSRIVMAMSVFRSMSIFAQALSFLACAMYNFQACP